MIIVGHNEAERSCAWPRNDRTIAVLSAEPFVLKIGKLEILTRLSYGLCTLLVAGFIEFQVTHSGFLLTLEMKVLEPQDQLFSLLYRQERK